MLYTISSRKCHFASVILYYSVVFYSTGCTSVDSGEEATKHLKAFIGEHYHASEEPVFPALWRTYNECQFVDDEGNVRSFSMLISLADIWQFQSTGDVLFYKNRKGQFATTVDAQG